MTTELNQQDTTGLAAAAAAVIAAASTSLGEAIGVQIALQPTAIVTDEIPSPGVEDVWVEIPLAGAVSGMTRLIIDGADVGAIVAAVKPDHSDDAPLAEDALAALSGAMIHFSKGVAAALRSRSLQSPTAQSHPGCECVQAGQSV